MVQRMEFGEALSGHMGIDLRGGNVSMSEQHLHNAQVRAMIEQMGRKCMAQRMR